MGLRSILAKPLAAMVHRQTAVWAARPAHYQQKIFRQLLTTGRQTQFGHDCHLKDVASYADFKQAVPLRDYEALKPYFDRVAGGEADVLWAGQPVYLAKTSGTTSGIKYIPITRDSIPNHIDGARNALLSYVYHTGKVQFLNGGLIFLSGSPALEEKGGIKMGRLSGIVNHHVPAYLRGAQKPSFATNCIADWEEKLDRIIDETLPEDMTLISGIPPWVQMYFNKIRQRTGKKIKDVFPNFSMFVYGGVNYAPYRQQLEDTIGKRIDSIETYPASEGFIAYQDLPDETGLLLQLNAGIFFEFVPLEEYFSPNPARLAVEEVTLGKNYALIINSNAGLWGYSIGDTVKFVSKNPYRLVVTGRVKHFISSFGEHVIGEEVERALQAACTQFAHVRVAEFTVTPQTTPSEGLPHHEWYIAYAHAPENEAQFAATLDTELRKLNVYYDDLIKGKVLCPLKIRSLPPEAFVAYMKSEGKLGGQNKVPRLSNDRKIADFFERHYARN